MAIYIIRRLAEMSAVLLVASILAYAFIQSIPGDPAVLYAGPDADAATIEAVRTAMGLDAPHPTRYWRWLASTLTGDLGISYASRIPVQELIASAIRPTLELTLAGIFVAIVVGLPTGFLAALFAGSWIDRAVGGFNALMLAAPNFWLGILLILAFSLQLGWLPSGGWVPFTEDPLRSVQHLLLPSLALGSRLAAVMSRFSRGSLIEVLKEPYIGTARAKGLATSRIVFKHGTRNALIPVLTGVGAELARLTAGAVVLESVFSWPGIGRLLLNAIGQRDFLVVQALLLLFVFGVVMLNFSLDLAYGIIDPRIRKRSSQGSS